MPELRIITCAGCPAQVEARHPNRKWCDECIAENNRKGRRAYYQANREQELAYHRAHKYGMTVEDIKSLLDKQGGVCPICLLPVSLDDYHLDHDHSTSTVRGVLHPMCNLAIGQLDDDPNRCDRAAAYLRRSPTTLHVVASRPGLIEVAPTTCTVCGRNGSRSFLPNGDDSFRCRDTYHCQRRADRQEQGLHRTGRRAALTPTAVPPARPADDQATEET